MRSLASLCSLGLAELLALAACISRRESDWLEYSETVLLPQIPSPFPNRLSSVGGQPPSDWKVKYSVYSGSLHPPSHCLHLDTVILMGERLMQEIRELLAPEARMQRVGVTVPMKKDCPLVLWSAFMPTSPSAFTSVPEKGAVGIDGIRGLVLPSYRLWFQTPRRKDLASHLVQVPTGLRFPLPQPSQSSTQPLTTICDKHPWGSPACQSVCGPHWPLVHFPVLSLGLTAWHFTHCSYSMHPGQGRRVWCLLTVLSLR